MYSSPAYPSPAASAPGGPGSDRPPRWHRLTTPLRVAGIGGCGLVLLVALVGLAGGLEEAPARELPVVPVDEFYEGEPWRVRVSGAGLFPYEEGDPIRPSDERNDLLVLSVDLEVTAPESRTDIIEVLYVTGIDGLGVGASWATPPEAGLFPADHIRLLRDGTSVISMHPGLLERVLFFWERAAGAGPLPAEIEVVLFGKTFRENSLTGGWEWLDHQSQARVVVSLRDLREDAPEPVATPSGSPEPAGAEGG